MSQSTLWDRFVVDTSSLVEILEEDRPDSAWDLVFHLIKQDRLKSVAAVVDELRNRMVPSGKFPKKWLTALVRQRSVLVLPDAQIIDASAEINIRYPKFSKPFGPYEIADPWVIGAARTHGLIVVTEERDTNPGRKRRIPWVCDQEGVKWCRLKRLLTAT